MIAAWMLYCIAIGLALTIVGVALERALHLAGRATRWAWVVALAGSFAIPAAAWLRPEAFSSVAIPVPAGAFAESAIAVAPLPSDAPRVVAPTPTSFSLSDLDALLRWGWIASSVLILAVLGVATLRLAALRRRWRASLLDGRAVVVSENVGPAVAGLWHPEVVVPGWALALSEPQRRLMLSHEEEHVRARDPWVLACGAAALVLMPWNPALWWHVRRLRLAVEMDCDARVLARGGPPPEYGELLLQVGQRRTQFALAALALGEPASFLELRIRRMATALPRWRWIGAAAALVVAAGAIVGACEAPRPMEPERAIETDVASGAADLARVARERTEVTMARIDSAMAEHLRPWIRSSLERYYPELLTQKSGPAVDVWFGHDSRLRVTHVARLVESAKPIQAARIKAVFPNFRPGTDGWGVVSRRALQGLVRDNVRVIWVNLDRTGATPTPPDTSRGQWSLSARWAALHVRRMFPQFLQGRDEPVYLWEVFDDGGHLVAHGTAPRALAERAVSTEQASRLIPGYDTLVAPHAKEHGVIGYGVLAPQSPPVLYVRVGKGATELHVNTIQDEAALVRRLALQYHPEVVATRQPNGAVALVMDAQHRLIAHAAGLGPPRVDSSQVSRSVPGETCLDVLTRLLPEFRTTQWVISGCADYDAQRNAVVYWGIPLGR
jgi:beta-lactamase regulating signal transducer with metallopeptidase domain